jgi:hypothetical protein
MVKAFGANAAHKNKNRLRGTTPHGNPMHLSRKVVYNIRKNNLPDNSPMCVLTLDIVHLDSNFNPISMTDYTFPSPLLLLAEWRRSKCWNSQTHIFFLISMGSASHTQQVALLPLSPTLVVRLNFTSPTKEQTITTEDSSNISPTKKKARSEKRPPSKSKKAAKETA